MNAAGKAVVGLLVSVLLIWWTLSDVAIVEVWDAIRAGNLLLLFLAVTVATVGFFVRALRWKVLLQPLKAKTSLDARFGAVSIGFMANNLLPARLGEFARAYAFSRMETVTMSGAFGSLVVERFLDGLVLAAFFLLPIALPGFPVEAPLQGGTMGVIVRAIVVVIASLIVFLGVLVVWPEPVLRACEGVAGRLPARFARRSVDALEAFLESLQVLRSPRLLTLALLWTIAFWTWHGLSFYLGMLAFGIDAGFLAAIFTEAMVGFGVALPAAPGFFGTFHASARIALEGVYGVAPARALAFAYGYHLGGFFPITFIGLWYAHRIGLSFKEMGRSEERVEDAIEERGTGS